MTTFRALPKIVIALVVPVALLAASASAASAASAWWHLGSGSRPSALVAGSAKDEVQEVTVSATGGFFKLQDVEESGLEVETKVARLPYDATAAEVQEGIERNVYSGGREVRVEEGKGDSPEFHSWVVTFPDQRVQPMATRLSSELTGAKSEASVKEASQGRPDGEILVSASNLGDASVNLGSAVHIRDTLPPGLRAVAFEATAPNAEGLLFFPQLFECSYKSLSCSTPVRVAPYEAAEGLISVVVEPGARTGGLNEASVSGGGVPSASISRPVPVSDHLAPSGVEDYELAPEEEGGAPDMRAGSHPFQLTTTLALNQTADGKPVALPKDLNFKLPPGLIGNPAPLPQCTIGQFVTRPTGGQSPGQNQCPPQTALGVAEVYLHVPLETTRTAPVQLAVPLFNLEPSVGEPARFGFVVEGTPVYLDTSVRTGGDYGVTVSVSNISQEVSFLSSLVTFWGVPGDPRHDNMRGWGCLRNIEAGSGFYPCATSEAAHPPPFLSLPTSCTGPMSTSVEADPWVQEGDFGSFSSYEPVPALDGCNRLPFAPEVKVSPDGQQASKPTGLTVDVHVPQEGQLNPEGLAQSNVKDITVTLPEGVTLNPSAADGLQGCSEAQVGYLAGESHPPSELHFTSTLPSPSCPDAAKVATVRIKSPLLPTGQFVEGAVYLASPQNFNVFPQENPFETHVAMYIVAEDPISGTLVKLPGRITLNQATGQITGVFEDNPQLAFEDAELHFFGGERAPLATPTHCGTYTTNATFTPWSGGEPVKSQSSFEITSGPNGSPCPGSALPFSPSLASGTTNNNAGSFTPLTTTMSREDGQQAIQSVTLHYPAGVSGLLSGVKLCGEAEANAGTCGPESEIGETIVSVGVGGDPFTVTGGKAYITGPYDGAPFGLSIVNPAKAGPFDLQQGRPVVVRAKIEVDPHTAALTITTDPSGAHAIPTIIEGFPLQIKHVNVLVNRPGFTFNPTNCTPTTVTGAIGSAEGSRSPVSVPFQVTNCASLKFAPKFAVSTSAKNSKANGTSLAVKLTYPSAPFGSEANIKQVKVELPRDLPSRLTTLQKACTAAQFDANPAGCPSASIIGHAKAVTPLIPVPLEGPAYFVSNGGEAFPNLIIVLQGYGVRIDLVGDTFISKAGVTSSTFKTVPDAPVGSFELVLPEGKYSALTALGNLCTEKLTMPTEFLAQNGASLHQNTPVSVNGCAKAKALTRAQRLAKALKACHKDKNKAKRQTCERAARKKYGSKTKKRSGGKKAKR